MSELAARQTGTNLGQRSASQQVAQVPEPGKVTLTQNLYRRTHAVAQADSATTSAPPDPPSRTATWQQIADAADDPNAQAELDIAWIESLPAHIQESIDTAFADSKAAAKAARSAAPGLTKIEAEIRAAQKQLIRDTKLRLAQANQPSGGNDVARDPIYAAEFQRLELERDHRKQAHLKQIAQTQDSAVPMEQPKQSVARPETSTVKRLEGKSLARTNFMSWAVHVCGTADAAKAHFMSIKQVKGHPGMFLAGDARARFEAALADFDAHNPGYTIVGTTVAHAQRGRHQERWGVGMLGHALGESFDLRAYDNPNIKIDDKHSYAYLIAKFGGDGGKRGSGRATMSISESAVERTGQETVEGKRSTEGTALIDEVRRQFAEMSLTSERLSRSLENEMPRLQAARDMYFDQPDLLAELAQAQSDYTRGDSVARKRLQSQVFSSPEEKLAAIGQIKQELAALVDEKADALAKSKATVQQALEHAFATWTAAIQIDIDADDAVLTENKTARTQIAEQQRALSSIDAADADAVAQLEAFAASHDLTRPDDKKRVPDNAKAYKKALARELQARGAKTSKTLASRDANAHADIKALNFYKAKLLDPAFVFGKGKKNPDGHWSSRYEAEAVPLMQLLENGTVHNDPMPTPTVVRARQGVFNAEVVATLVKYGFAPGANYGDTMHFDFIEGFNRAVPGGRSQENLKRTRFSPEGDLDRPMPTHNPESET